MPELEDAANEVVTIGEDIGLDDDPSGQRAFDGKRPQSIMGGTASMAILAL